MEQDRESSDLEGVIDIEDTTLLSGKEFELPRTRQLRDSVRDRMCGFLLGLLIAMALFMTLYHFRLSSHGNHLPEMYEGTDENTGKPASWFNGDCGNSAAEARGRGCRFDRVLHSWLPLACTNDDDLQDERDFIAAADWKYYSEEGSQLLTEDVYRGEAKLVFTSWRWHLVHCTFVWKKLHRALLDGRNIDSYIANFNHTHHCSELLLMDIGPQEPSTRIFTKFPTCG